MFIRNIPTELRKLRSEARNIKLAEFVERLLITMKISSVLCCIVVLLPVCYFFLNLLRSYLDWTVYAEYYTFFFCFGVKNWGLQPF